MLSAISGKFRDINIIGENPDEQLHTEDGSAFRVNSKVLSERNTFFHGLLACKDVSHSTLIKSISGDMLKIILIYLDSGEISLNRQIMMDAFIWSDFFQINSLKETCKEFVVQNLTERNCLNILTIVWGISSFGLQAECYRYVQLHFKKIIRASEACAGDLPIEILKTFLKEKSLNITGERDIWLVIKEWVSRNTSERLTHVPELLTHMSISEIEEELATEIMLSPIVNENPVCVELNTNRRENESSLTNCSLLLDFALKLQPVLFGPRQPSRLHLIYRWKNGPELFCTFDDNYDLWRKVDYITSSCASQDLVYFRKCLTSKSDASWLVAFDPSHAKYFFTTCSIPPHSLYHRTFGDCTYFFGNKEIKNFHPETSTYTVIKHQPYLMYVRDAIELNGGIFFIGIKSIVLPNTLMQVYWPENDTWSVPAVPKRGGFHAVKYRGCLFAFEIMYKNNYLGVAKYDHMSDSWRRLPDLPFKNESLPRIIVLNETMYAYSSSGTEHVVCWDAEQEMWEPISESSPLMHLHQHAFYSMDDPEAVKKIMRRDSNTNLCWVKSYLL